MSGKTQMSDKTKKILTGVGIGFGTLVVFLASFILAFSLIVNPINFFTVSDAGTVEENEKLKEEVQTLTDEIEHLNTTVDKYKASANSASVTAPATVTTPNLLLGLALFTSVFSCFLTSLCCTDIFSIFTVKNSP